MQRFLQLLLNAVVALTLGGTAAADSASPSTVRRVQPFDLKDVRLLDGPFREAMLRDRDYLLSLDADRLLHTFRLTAGLPSAAEPLGGWEDPKGELRGHSLGHYLSACALMYASTGDERLKTQAELIVVELAKCQAAMPAKGYHPGFLSAYPEEFFDRVDACRPVWAPYYTLHKILAGLLDVHVHCGHRPALDVLTGLADWLKFRVGRLSHEQLQKALGNEHGGMNEVLANLSAVTKNPDHLSLARAFNHEFVFDPLARGEDRLNGLHANTQIPKIIGAAREYELTGEQPFHDVATGFWQSVALRRSYCIGGHSDNEHFFPVEDFSQHLSPATCETCNTYNMLKLTRHLFAWEPSAQIMDFYERALFNHILASQDPAQGMFLYFASLKPGTFKVYSTPTNSFWCCVGTGMENHAKYGDTIFFHDSRSLYLNLLIPAELTWREKGLVVRQETRFPEADSSRLTFHCQQPQALALKVRWPAWAQSGLTLAVNGKAAQVDGQPGSYVTLEREWRDGDQVEVRLPLSLRQESLPNAANVVAFLYGPLVLAGELGTAGLERTSPYVRSQLDLAHAPTPPVPGLLGQPDELWNHITPVAGQPLTFRTQGLGKPQDVTLIPFYRLHHQRYTVYWTVYTEENWRQRAAEIAAAEQKRKEYEARIVDELRPGEPQPEIDHQLAGEHTHSGEFHARRWRDANQGGWFSFQMRVAPQVPLSLLCTYWGSDVGARHFDILVDGEKIATQTLERNQPGAFFDVEYALPAKLVEGKQRVTVKFQAHPNGTAGGLFGCRLLKSP